MNMQAIIDLYGGGVLGDKHGLLPSSQMASSQQPSTSVTEIRSVAKTGDHRESTSHVVVEYHAGDSRLPTKHRI